MWVPFICVLDDPEAELADLMEHTEGLDYIREAQNMLKYTDLPVKEIVTRLNFPNQTTFYRFFKIQTGKTPIEYRKG